MPERLISGIGLIRRHGLSVCAPMIRTPLSVMGFEPDRIAISDESFRVINALSIRFSDTGDNDSVSEKPASERADARRWVA